MGSRYALVIGNAAYRNIERLENAVNDARDISAALEKLGFDVDMRLDATEAQFDAAINAYIAKLGADSGNEGFFWYAGHGVQIRDQNYLLPVDAGIESESTLQRHSFSLDKLLSDLEGARNRVNVVILDACRNNPLPSSSRGVGNRGLAVIQDVPGDLFLMFSTAAGDVAADGKGKRNSPFAEAFLKYITSGEAVVQMAANVAKETMQLTNNQQRPFTSGSIISDTYYSLNPERSGGGGAGSGGYQTAPQIPRVVVNPNIPSWLDEQAPKDMLWGIGFSNSASQSLRLTKADADAMADIIRQLQTVAQNMIAYYHREAGIDAPAALGFQESLTRLLAQTTLQGAVRDISWITLDNKTLWVRYRMSKTDAAKLVASEVNKLVKSEGLRYAEFKAMDTILMMNIELGKYTSKPEVW